MPPFCDSFSIAEREKDVNKKRIYVRKLMMRNGVEIIGAYEV